MKKVFQLSDHTLEGLVVTNFRERKIVQLGHIGVIFLTKRDAIAGRNPQTGVPISLPSRVVPVFLAFQCSNTHPFNDSTHKLPTEESFQIIVQQEGFDIFNYHNEELTNIFVDLIPRKATTYEERPELRIVDRDEKLVLLLKVGYLSGETEREGEHVMPARIDVRHFFSKELRSFVQSLTAYVRVITQVNEAYGFYDDGDSHMPKMVDFIGLKKTL